MALVPRESSSQRAPSTRRGLGRPAKRAAPIASTTTPSRSAKSASTARREGRRQRAEHVGADSSSTALASPAPGGRCRRSGAPRRRPAHRGARAQCARRPPSASPDGGAPRKELPGAGSGSTKRSITGPEAYVAGRALSLTPPSCEDRPRASPTRATLSLRRMRRPRSRVGTVLHPALSRGPPGRPGPLPHITDRSECRPLAKQTGQPRVQVPLCQPSAAKASRPAKGQYFANITPVTGRRSPRSALVGGGHRAGARRRPPPRKAVGAHPRPRAHDPQQDRRRMEQEPRALRSEAMGQRQIADPRDEGRQTSRSRSTTSIFRGLASARGGARSPSSTTNTVAYHVKEPLGVVARSSPGTSRSSWPREGRPALSPPATAWCSSPPNRRPRASCC